jgi:phage terminase large subunit
MFQVKQIYRTQRLVEDHAPLIKAMIVDCGIPIPRIEKWICDHDAEDRATLEKHLGIKTTAAFKEISSGIQAVKGRFKANRLFLNLNAVDDPDPELEKKYLPLCTADEVTGYSWSDKKQETPIKEQDHGCDEMRYGVAYVDKLDRKPINVRTSASVGNYISQVASPATRPGY